MITKTESTEFLDFLRMSAVLTDFTEFRLRGTGQAGLYFATIVEIAGEQVVSELLDAFKKVEAASGSDASAMEKGIRTEIMSDEKLGVLARNVIKLWYIGTWYQLPQAWRERYGMVGDDRTFIPAPSAYVEGLLWPAIGAHPPGAKAPGYGTWTEAPVIPPGDRPVGASS
jgi:hypothetical protein